MADDRTSAAPTPSPTEDGAPPPAELPAAPELTRRRLLALGPVALATPWLLEGLLGSKATAAAQTGGALAGGLPERWMSIGYLDGSEGAEDLEAIARHYLLQPALEPPREALSRVVPAHRLLTGDQSLANAMVKVRIHGLYPRLEPGAGAFGSAHLTVLYPPPHDAFDGSLMPYFAWGFTDLPRNTPAPVTFCAPLGVDGSLPMTLEVSPRSDGTKLSRRLPARPGAPEQPGHPSSGRYHTDFTVDWYEGRPKLQRGLYLLALGLGTWERSRELPPPSAPPALELCSLVVSFDAMDEDEP